jgi:hypothetical protein
MSSSSASHTSDTPAHQAHQAPRYGDIDCGRSGCFGFRTCGVRGVLQVHVGAESRIIEDWHLEDNLTFLQQAGLVTIDGST